MRGGFGSRNWKVQRWGEFQGWVDPSGSVTSAGSCFLFCLLCLPQRPLHLWWRKESTTENPEPPPDRGGVVVKPAREGTPASSCFIIPLKPCGCEMQHPPGGGGRLGMLPTIAITLLWMGIIVVCRVLHLQGLRKKKYSVLLLELLLMVYKKKNMFLEAFSWEVGSRFNE